jgi:hypothetical protein
LAKEVWYEEEKAGNVRYHATEKPLKRKDD